MRYRPRNVFRSLLGLCAWCGAVVAQEAALVPLDDAEVETPLLPAGLSRTAPELFGRYAHLWTLGDGARVIQYYGEFAMHTGERRLQSQDAVIWMQPAEWEGIKYYHYAVFLSHHAYVRDTGGTVTSGPTLFVTLNATQPAAVEADISTYEPAETTELYREAEKIRRAIEIRGEEGLAVRDLQILDPQMSLRAPRAAASETVRHQAEEEMIDERRGLITAKGNVYLSRGLIDSDTFLEIRADAAVLFLSNYAGSATVEEEESPSTTKPSLDPDSPFPVEEAPDEGAAGSGTTGLMGSGRRDLGVSVTGAYLTGDVIMSQGDRHIRASEIYYDFQFNRALILDAVMWAMAPERNLPLYVRADRVRQLSSTEYYAEHARVSTSEFYTPHVHLGAERVYLTDSSQRAQPGDLADTIAGTYRMYDTTLNVEGVPILYWPYGAGDFRQSESAIRSVRMGYSDDFGATFETKWYLYSLLGVEEPQGVNALLRTDYYSDRGPGFGPEIEYEQENRYGFLRGYYINDHGEDNLGDYRDGNVPHDNRGYVTWRHREFLPDDWELTLETSYISDPNFLEEYFRSIFEEDKAQETLLYVKKQKNNWAFTTLAQWRINDFLTQTEHLPDAAFHLIGEPLGEFASLYSQTNLGAVRYRADNRRLVDYDRFWDNTESTDVTFRANQRNEIDFPIKAGPVNIVPYAMGQAGYWDGLPHASASDRLFGNVGLRTGSQLWRLYEDAESDLFDVHGVRHIIKPESTSWVSASNLDSFDLSPFDQEIEGIDDFYGSSLALRQRWQTKRGAPGDWRIVDWITFDVELNLFGNSPENTLDIGRFYGSRPENSTARNHIRTDFMYRLSDTTAILSDSNFDLNDGDLDLFNISYVVERTPRFSYAIGWRRIHDTDSSLAGLGVNYKLNAKYRFAARLYYDIERGQTETAELVIIRKFPNWYGALILSVDEIEDNFGISLAMWPEGMPNAALGGGDYVPELSESTGLRPENQ